MNAKPKIPLPHKKTAWPPKDYGYEENYIFERYELLKLPRHTEDFFFKSYKIV